MATLFEQSISHNNRCFACGSLVYAVEKKMTTNHVYHNRCFRCRICKRNLTGYSLNEEGDDIYCGNCYRKKQRGDCDSLEFHRAAAEKAQYVHNRHHPDQQNSFSQSRPGSLRDVARNPSLTLRQYERQFLSHQPINHYESSHEVHQKSHPFTINTSFSSPAYLPTLKKDVPSPQFSPFSTIRTETTITPRVTQTANDEQTKSRISTTTGSSNGGIEFRLNKSSVDLSNVTSPRADGKTIIIPDLNETTNDQKTSKFPFPDYHLSSIRRRSSSANYHAMRSLRVE